MSKFKLYDYSGDSILAADFHYAIVAARFNREIVDVLLQGATSTLSQCGASEDQISVVHVPGAFEIPLTCQKLAASGKVDALIALGCVIRGDTPHFDYVCTTSAHGVMQVGLKYDIPVINGILTVDNLGQAQVRSQINGDNKGSDAAYVAMEMLGVYSELDKVIL